VELFVEVTPTGAVILQAYQARCEPCAPLLLDKIGYGAGHPGLAGHPRGAQSPAHRSLSADFPGMKRVDRQDGDFASRIHSFSFKKYL
jgi:hypothetical protein